MKFSSFKKALLPFVGVMCLASCEQSIYGTYSFQLGSNKGTHFGIYLTLSDEHPEGSEDNKYKLLIETSGLNGAGFSDNDEDEVSMYAKTLDQAFSKNEASQDNDEPIEIDGTYTISDYNDKKKLNLTIDILYDIQIPPSLVDKLLVAYVSDGRVDLKIPVGMDDLMYQLYWYGYDISPDADSHPEPVAHPIDTHPTPEEIQAIRDGDGTLTYPDFRDFWQLTMSLSK